MDVNSYQTLNDTRLRWLWGIALLVQLFFCITQVGFFHPDQHFQLIEFSSWQMGEPTGATSVWELTSHIRPTLQVYLFSGFVSVCRFCHINDAYTQLLILRLLFGVSGLLLFNAIGLYYFKSDKKLLYLVLLLINFSWVLPYTRTLFSSEMASSMVFFGAILLYERKGTKTLYVFLIGFLFSLAFYFRFQVAFGLIGFGLWMLLIERKYTRLLPMAIGFGIGLAMNMVLDTNFYHQFVFTPYEYYRVNITEGKAAEFGTASFLYYVVMLLLVIGTPPISIVLFYYSLKGVLKQYRQPLAFAVVFFIVGHCLVAHKEERFLYPVVNVLPILTGWGLSSLLTYYQQAKTGARRFLKNALYASIALNVITLIALLLNPIAQTVEFSRKLTNTFKNSNPTIYCLGRTPFETESHLPLTFYRRNAPNMNLVRINDADSARYLHNAWVVTTYNDAKPKLPLLDSLGYKPQFYSSAALWNINKFLQSKEIGTINEIWVLYKKE